MLYIRYHIFWLGFSIPYSTGDRKRWEVRPSSPGVIELQRQDEEDEWLFDEREFYGVSDGGTASDSLDEFDLR